MAFRREPNNFLQPSSTLPLPTPPSTSYSTSNQSALSSSRLEKETIQDDSYNEAAFNTPTRSLAGSDSSLFLSPEPNTQSKPTFDIPSSPSSSLPSSLASPSSSRRGSPSPKSRNSSREKNRVSISTRLQFLARLAEAEEPVLPEESLDVLHQHLDGIQRGLVDPAELSPIEPTPTSRPAVNPIPQLSPNLDVLRSVDTSHKELLSTTKKLTGSLRDRQEENVHIYALFTEKLEAVAQRCIQLQRTLSEATTHYQNELREKDAEIGDMVMEINRLEIDNERLDKEGLERDVVIRAMGAAVGGLEGWVGGWTKRQERADRENVRAVAPLTPRKGVLGANVTPRSAPTPKKTKEVIRGKGRFRGRVLVEEEEEEADGDGEESHQRHHSPFRSDAASSKLHRRSIPGSGNGRPMTTTTTNNHDPRNDSFERGARGFAGAGGADSAEIEILDGLRAWISGFRDVEEGLREQLSPGSGPGGTGIGGRLSAEKGGN